MAFHSAAPLLLVGLVVSACAEHDSTAEASASELDALVLASPDPSPAAAPVTEPVSDPRQVRKLEAARGLRYDGGRAEIVPEEAAAIAATRDRAAADAAYAEGVAALARNELIDAIRAHTRAVLLAPDVATMYLGLGHALVTQKGWESKAAAALRSGLDLDPSSPELWYWYADATWRVGDVEGAVAAFERARALEPDRPRAVERLAKIEFLRGDDARAWELVHAAEALGGEAPAQLRAMLAARTPEPAR